LRVPILYKDMYCFSNDKFLRW